MEENDILGLGIRRQIFKFILNYPGLHLRELSRNLDVPRTTLDYHLKYLEKENFLLVKSENRFKRYYAKKKVGTADKIILGLMRQYIPRRIILFLFLYPEHSRMDISQDLEIPPTTLSFHLKKLMDMDIVEKRRLGHSYAYRIKNQKEMYNVLISYESSLSDDILGPFLEYVKYVIPDGIPPSYRHRRKKKDIDEIIEAIYEIFPNPYHV